ncbi:hypothetical protein M1145_01705 [Patescibacteria group bacterium]|nr:hypothetical protein [Patescibacteria group bacterium]
MNNNKLTFNSRIIYFLSGFLLLAIGLSFPIVYIEIIILLIAIIFLTNAFVGVSIVNNVILNMKTKGVNVKTQNTIENEAVSVKKSVSRKKTVRKSKPVSKTKPSAPIKKTSKKK